MNYVWTPTFPMDDYKETLGLMPLQHRQDTVKRDFESEYSPKQLSANKRQRKSKTKTESSSSEDLNVDGPKDKGRGRYACLSHRMKHKRCPPDCKERRPKPMQSTDLSPESPSIASHMDSPQSARNVVQIDDFPSSLSLAAMAPSNIGASNAGYPVQQMPQSAPIGLNPMQTVSALPSMADGCPIEWDSVEWDHLMDDQGQGNLWDDIQSNTPQWEPDSVLANQSEDKAANSNEGIAKDYASVNGSSMGAHGVPLKSLLEPILLSRDSFERWIMEPYLNRLLQGFFVRVRIGEYMDTSVYRIARIEEVVDRAFFTYNLGKEQTTKGIVLQIGSTRKTFSLLSVSNKAPSDVDLSHWEEEMIKSKMALSEDEVRQKEEVIRVMNLKYPPKMPTSSFGSTSN